MKLLTHIPAWLKNKYFIAFASFAVIMLFLDKNDIFTQMARSKELRELKQSKEFYTRMNEAEQKGLEAFKHNPAAIEKYAREKYLMKRENEDLFLVPEKPDTAPAATNN
ncbi:MAG TPA: septum formation initiator family protein [Chitinophagaceae bacterium]